MVVLVSAQSFSMSVISGVLYGTILGPLIIYMHDSPDYSYVHKSLYYKMIWRQLYHLQMIASFKTMMMVTCYKEEA